MTGAPGVARAPVTMGSSGGDAALPRCAMRWLIALFVCAPALAACGAEPVDDEIEAGRRYVESAAFRRRALEDSLVNPDNGYSRLRLAQYTQDQWGALPTWNPPVAAVTDAPPDEYEALDVEGVEWDRDALVALGRAAFHRYPLRPRSALQPLVDHPERYGGAVIDGQRAGLVWAVVPGGDALPANTCATCHTSQDGRVGVGNAALDMAAATGAVLTPPGDLGWGPGRVDVTPDGVLNPARIPDVRPVKFQTHLHYAATVCNDVVALAIRLETLYITSLGEALRPPRKLMFALALYLHSLAREPASDPDHPGAPIFASRCAGCHGDDGRPGPPVDLDAVGTDDAVALSLARWTGQWRVPSLVGVGDRGPLTASGAFGSVGALLNPDRDGGHVFTQGLTPGERTALAEYLDEY